MLLEVEINNIVTRLGDENDFQKKPRKPSQKQRDWLERGLSEPGGKLPLFNYLGQRISARTVESCINNGWAELWFDNPLKPDWHVCKITEMGRKILSS